MELNQPCFRREDKIEKAHQQDAEGLGLAGSSYWTL